MQKITLICFLVLPFGLIAQFNVSEFYAVGRFSFGMGMNSYTYKSELGGRAPHLPKSLQIELGSGLIPEIGVGFKIASGFYVETSVFYSKTQKLLYYPKWNYNQ